MKNHNFLMLFDMKDYQKVWKAILKKEEVNVNNYETFKEAKLALFEFIESWYNNQRLHSTLNYVTPNEKYKKHLNRLALT